MPFMIIRNDIALVKADAIVNTADPEPIIGSGTDTAVHRKAGPGLIKARRKIGRIEPGDARATPAYGLDARYVIHAVSPVWTGGCSGEEHMLRRTYDSALYLAKDLGCRSVAFPLMAAGNLGFPKDAALRTAVSAFSDFLIDSDMDITLVVFDPSGFRLSEKLMTSVESFIDDNYIESAVDREYSGRTLGDIERRNLENAEWLRIERRRRGQLGECGSCSMPARREETKAEISDGRKKKEEPYVLFQTAFDSGEGEEEEDDEELAYYSADGDASPEELREVERRFRKEKRKERAESLDHILGSLDAGFSETLMELIRMSGESNADIYKRANIDRKLFSKIQNNRDYRPSKQTVCAFALALKLDMKETEGLLRRAGYALSRSFRFDVIIMYCIEHRIWNVIEVNTILFRFDEQLIGNAVM